MASTRHALSNGTGRSRTWARAAKGVSTSVASASHASAQMRMNVMREDRLGTKNAADDSGASAGPSRRLVQPLHVPPAGVLEADAFIEEWSIDAMQRRGDDEAVRAAILPPAFRLVHERAPHTATAHLGRHDERRELHDGPRGVKDGARVYRGETDGRAIDLGDEGVVARGAQAPEPLGHVGRVS